MYVYNDYCGWDWGFRIGFKTICRRCLVNILRPHRKILGLGCDHNRVGRGERERVGVGVEVCSCGCIGGWCRGWGLGLVGCGCRC